LKIHETKLKRMRNNHENEAETDAKQSRNEAETDAKQSRNEAENEDETNKNNNLSQARLKHTRIKDKIREDKKKKETPIGVSKKENLDFDFSDVEDVGENPERLLAENLAGGNRRTEKPVEEERFDERLCCFVDANGNPILANSANEAVEENAGDDGESWWDEPDGKPLLATQKPAAKTGKTKRACRLPEDWMPSVSEAMRLGLSEEQARFEVERFRDYWRARSGKDATKSDWPATWRYWVRGEVQKIKNREENRKFYADSRGNAQPQKSQNMRKILGKWVNGSDLTPGGTCTYDEMYPPEIYDTVIGFADGI